MSSMKLGLSDPHVLVEPVNQDDVETLRSIEAALEWVESERPSGPDIATCLDPVRRSEFPAADPIE